MLIKCTKWEICTCETIPVAFSRKQSFANFNPVNKKFSFAKICETIPTRGTTVSASVPACTASNLHRHPKQKQNIRNRGEKIHAYPILLKFPFFDDFFAIRDIPSFDHFAFTQHPWDLSAREMSFCLSSANKEVDSSLTQHRKSFTTSWLTVMLSFQKCWAVLNCEMEPFRINQRWICSSLCRANVQRHSHYADSMMNENDC